MRRDAQNASLSSAAAAAALKARPMSPTIVGDVQSKRVLRRTPSVSSATGLEGNRRRELARSPSVGSMTERTFRSPSPGRSPIPTLRDVPPVPSLPLNEGATGRSLTQAFRPASQRSTDNQASWFGGAAAGDPRTVRKASSAIQLSSRTSFEPRPGSVSPSINFSYPRVQSPTGSLRSQSDDQRLVYDPNSRRMVAASTLDIKPARKQSKKKAVSNTLADSGPGLPGTAEQAAQPRPKKTKKTQKATKPTTEAAQIDDNGAHDQEPVTIVIETPRLTKKPSIVREEPEREEWEAAEDQKSQPKSGNVGPEENTASPKTKAKKASATKQQRSPKTSKAPKTPESKVKNNIQQRAPSESPARSTRFASSTDQLVVKHDPPPRSLSPRKSALKHSSPTRAISPSDDGSDVSGVGLTPEESALRKKNARVSWNDRSTVVASADSEQGPEALTGVSPSPSPPTKKVWHNIVPKQLKKEAITLDEGETMAPRPALPSFGSVREKKVKDVEERPLVRPAVATGKLFQPALSDSVLTITEAANAFDTVIDVDRNSLSSGDSLLDDTSDEMDDSMTEVGTEVSAKGSKANILKQGPEEDVIPTISISQASPQPNGQGPFFGEEGNGDTGSNQIAEATIDHDNANDSDTQPEDDIYADAHDTLAEVDGDGFMSLDAVLESPTGSPTATKFTESALTPATDTASSGQNPADWENAKAYWKSLSQEKRRQLELEALEEAGESGSTTAGSIQKAQPVQASDRTYQITPGSSWDTSDKNGAAIAGKAKGKTAGALRASMRDATAQPTSTTAPEPTPKLTMRKSMRDSRPTSSSDIEGHATTSESPLSTTTGSTMRKSLRQRPSTADDFASRSNVNGGARPASYHPDSALSHQRKTSRDLALTQNNRKSMVSPTLRRRGSDSSESSFTRARAGSRGTREFRRSMRSGGQETSDPTANRFSLRSMSPTAFKSSSAVVNSSTAGINPGRMRQSLRGESADAASRRRGLFGKSSKGNTKTKPSGSRFADSSDEEDEPTSLFRSRFADSSDEEEPARPQSKSMQRSLRNKSKRATASATDIRSTATGFDSPDIPESNLITQPKRVSTLEQSQNVNSTETSTPTRAAHVRRGSFMSMLRRKKDAPERHSIDMSDAADAGLARETSWPLPDEHQNNGGVDVGGNSGSDKDRPSTSNGAPKIAKGKSKYLRRRSASQGMVGLDHTTLNGDPVDVPAVPAIPDLAELSPQKKKKFGTLRKMLRLHD